jgi:sec-independent protein translocase protein TatC
MAQTDYVEDEDWVGGKPMTLLEHLIELRNRLVVSAIAVLIGTIVSFIFARDFIDFLVDPAKDAIDDFNLVYTEPMGFIGTYFRVSLLGGLAIAMPILLYEVLAFVTPALTKEEKRWLFPVIFGASGMFLGGMAFAYYIALPPSIEFLLTFGEEQAQPVIKIDSYFDFVTRLVFWIGVSFETPLVIMFFARLGLVTARQLLRWWRYSVVVAFIMAAIVTPTIDPVTQSLVAGPIIILYAMGIVLAKLVGRPSRFANPS